MAIGTPIMSVIEDMISYYMTLLKLDQRGQPPARGILVENKDSYADILAKTFTTIGAQGGPAVLESAPELISDAVRYELYEDLISKRVLAKDEPGLGELAPETFKESFGVLLRSNRLVRTMADEVSLWARDNLFQKAAKKIQLTTGSNANIAAVGADMIVPAAVQAEILDISHDNAFAKGIILETKEADQKIKIITREDAASLSVVQGAANAAAEGTSRRLLMENSSVTLQLNADVNLKLAQGPEASLNASGAEFLSLKPSGVTLQQSGSNKLTMAAASAALAHSAKIELSGGNASGVFATGQLSLTVSGGQAKLDGAFITIG
jgi:hypothetical protein